MSQRDGYMGINEICADTGFNQSTVHRILNEMAQCGYVEKNDRYKKYKIGMEAVILASRFMNSNSLISAARDELKELNRITGETVHLVTVTDYELVYIDKIDTKHSLGLMSAVGKRNPLYCTSGGKAIIAFSDQVWIDTFIAAVELKAHTSMTITDETTFRRELDKVREQGYAIDNREHHEDIICVGAPIFSNMGGNPIAAISVAAPSYRFDLQTAEKYAPLVVAATNNISKKLGGAI